MEDHRASVERVQGSPHFFLWDGTAEHNPGIDLRWQGEPKRGFPVIDVEDSGRHESLVRQAAGR